MGRLLRTVDYSDTYKSEQDEPQVNVLEKVTKLIPTEVLTAWIAIFGLLQQSPKDLSELKWGAYVICLLMTPVYLFLSEKNKKGIGLHLVTSSLAFVVWSYSISGALLLPAEYYDGTAASVSLILFSLVSAVLPIK